MPSDEEKDQPESASSDTQGKTFADVVDGILTTPVRLLSFIVVLAALAGIAFGFVLLFQRLMGVTPSEITISPAGTAHVMFAKADGKNKEYLITVHPQGWQNTRISINQGDVLKFFAGGSVNIDLDSILETVHRRYEYEDQVTKAHHLARDSPKEVPEQYFSEEQKRSLKPANPWVGPSGNADVASTAWAGRAKNRVLPDQPGGALIGAISEGGQAPNQTAIFMIGESNQHRSATDGYLWFNVNDVRNIEDANNPNLFYLDNLGFFWVRVSIEPKKN